ncbi:hypothetical protein QNN00_18140 [Bacillus velezensis]|nr:hypothetical protein [Bacillus velezensis]
MAEKENYEVLKTEVAHIKERLKEQAEDRKIMLETQKQQVNRSLGLPLLLRIRKTLLKQKICSPLR